MAQQGKKYMYPRAEEGRGAGNMDFSQAFRTSHLGEVLCNTNPLQQKFLEQQWDDIDREKRRREATLFHYQRNFFIAQVFGKGLNPHLNRSEDSATTDPGGDLVNLENTEPGTDTAVSTRLNNVGTNRENLKKRHEILKTYSNDESNIEAYRKAEADMTSVDRDVGSTMITQGGELPPESSSDSRSQATPRPVILRCQTSGDLKVKRNQSQSLPTLASNSDVTAADTSLPPTRDKLHVSFMQERAKSTSDLADYTSKRGSSHMLPSIQRNRKLSITRKPEVIEEVSEDPDVDSTVVSVHTTTDHVGLSAFRRAQKKDISTLRKDPSRLFPKMRVLLGSYDSDTQGTFNQIMKLGEAEEGDSFSPVSLRHSGKPSRAGSKSAKEVMPREKQRIKVTIKSAKEAGKNRNLAASDDKLNHKFTHSKNSEHAEKSEAHSSLIGQSERTQGGKEEPRVDRSGGQGKERSDVEGSRGGGSGGGQVQGDVNLSETQRYVKMIQQLTAFLPEHLLATAEEQIRKMSNTEQIMKFKKKMIKKNHERMKQDTKADPRWRKLEGTLVSDGAKEKWHKRYRAWYQN